MPIDYKSCNNLVAKHFFNANKADEEVKIFLTRNLINEIGEENHITNFWDKVICIFKELLENEPTFYGSILNLFKQNPTPENGVPSQVLALSFLTLPFSYEGEESFRGNEYYRRATSFLKSIGIKYEIDGNNLNSIECLWQGLENWTLENEGINGIFMIPDLGFKYVGKPFSQCLIKPSFLKKLPKLFYDSKLIPSDAIPSIQIKQFILKNLNGLGIQSFQTRFTKDEFFRNTYVKYIKSHFLNWNGETSVVEQERNKTIGGKQILRGLLQLKFSRNEGTWKLQYRVKSKSIFPEFLDLDGIKFHEETNGFSNSADLPNIESILVPKKDHINKIEVQFTQKDVRLFVVASKFRLSSKVYLEIDYLNNTDKFKVLVNKASIADFIELDLKGLTNLYEWDSHTLYAVDEVAKLQGFKGLEYEETEPNKINVELFQGLKLNGRKYLSYGKPTIRIINALGDEKLQLEYESGENLELYQNPEFSDLWNFPNDVKCHNKFRLYSDSQPVTKNIEFVDPNKNVSILDDSLLYKRNKLGKIDNDINPFFRGTNLFDSNDLMEWRRVNEHFQFIKDFGNLKTTVSAYNFDLSEKLYSYITEKGTLNYKLFSDAYDFFCSDNDDNNGLNKRLTIRYLGYLGFIDFELKKNSIKVNRPQLIPIPHNGMGYKLMLIGGRSENLVNQLRDLCARHEIGFFVKKQPYSKLNLPLPKRICLRLNYSNIPDIIEDLKNLNIHIDTNHSSRPKLIQIGISKLFSCNIIEYRNSLSEAKPKSNYNKFLFNPETLKYEPINEYVVDHGLIKHQLNAFEKFFIYWKEGKSFECDEEYGKFLVLEDLKRNIILYNPDTSQLAIPVKCQLPRLFAEAIALFNGLIPENKYIKRKNYEGYFNIYSNVPSTIAQNEFKRILGQKIIEVKSL